MVTSCYNETIWHSSGVSALLVRVKRVTNVLHCRRPTAVREEMHLQVFACHFCLASVS